MRNLLVLLLLCVCVSSIFSKPAAIEKEKLQKNLLIAKLPDGKLKKTATEKLIKLPEEAEPKLRNYDYGPCGCYVPDCRRACRAYGYYDGKCIYGGCYCVYYDYDDYYNYY